MRSRYLFAKNRSKSQNGVACGARVWYNTQKEIGQGDVMAILKCKMCGGDIELSADKTFGTCESCGSTMTFPKVDDDQRANRFNRGNQFRRAGEFDKALTVYEQIVQEDENDAEAHWCCALCRFGIEYVEDPNTFEYLPTCHRASFDSFLEDVDYLAAVEHSDGVTRRQYQKDAQKIAEVQRGILATSQNEEPFDVFICYKETEDDGRRTRDSLFAQDIYYQLTEQGRRVFFSRITLEDKAGTEYEPYIFAALNSAKVMILVTTSAEHANAVWVKNEWSRFLSLMRKDRTKLLLPCYRDMDPYDLPEALSVLQSYDMSKIGFIQDLTRGVNKVLNADRPKETVKETVVVQPQRNTNAAPLLERAFMFLEDGDWDSANEYCEKVLDIEPKNAEAYLGKLMAELKVKKRDALKDQPEPFDNRNNYKKALRFGDEKLKQKLSGDIAFINARNEEARKTGIYNDGVKAMDAASTESAYKMAAAIFQRIPGFRDADALAERCLEQAEICRKDAIYQSARYQMTNNTVSGYESAIKTFRTISGWKDADALLADCERRIGEISRKKQENEHQHKEIIDGLNHEIADVEKERQSFQTELSNLKGLFTRGRRKELEAIIEVLNGKVAESKSRLQQETSYYRAEELYMAEKYRDAIALLHSLINYKDSKRLIKECWDHVAVRNTIAAGTRHTIGLRSDGTVVATKYTGNQEYYHGQCKVSGWMDIVAIAAGCSHTVGLKSDGTVVATKYTGDQKIYDGQCDVSGWKDIVAIAAGLDHTVGIRSDGTVIATKCQRLFNHGQCDVSSWTDIVAIAAGRSHTVGLKSDGTVVAIGWNDDGRCNVSDWKDIVAIAAGYNHTVGLRADGTVVATGENDDGKCNVSGWTDIVAIAVGSWHTVGLRSDGTVVATGENDGGQCDVSGWKDIVAIAAGGWHTVGLRSDGTVVATSSNSDGQCDVSGWKDIKVPDAK